MLAIIIILWFILFPVIPIILATLGAIVTAVLAFTGILSKSLQADASDKMGGFCFAEDANIVVEVEGKEMTKPACQIKLGDQLARGGGRVTTVIQMNGKDIPLYQLHGIHVSGSHLVMGTEGEWKSVSEDERAIRTDRISPIIYCFNTTSNMIPIRATDHTIIWFRDWEEIKNDDDHAQYMWNYLVSSILHRGTDYTGWKSNLRPYCEDALMGQKVCVKTSGGWVPFSELSMSSIILDSMGKEQPILGVVYGAIHHAEDGDGLWHTERYERDGSVWLKSENTVRRGTSVIQGMTLITETGEFVVWDENEQHEKIIRDFTEVGYQTIHETYSFVEARLRT